MTRIEIVIGVLMFAAVLIAAGKGASHSSPPKNFLASVVYWQERIAKIGGSAAYAEFANFVAPLDASAQHNLAHSFGESLYRERGIDGISVCDSRFSYGCYHQLVGDAIAAQGLGVVASINTDCLKLPSAVPCQHGIGHGLVGYLGYSDRALKKAIAECVSIDTGDSLQGCFGGAFMEFNMRTLAGGDASSTRPLSPDPNAPCDSFSSVAKASCYLYQPQWWDSVLRTKDQDIAELFEHMGRDCAALDPSDRQACFEGIGLMAPPDSGYGPNGSRLLCARAANSPADTAHCMRGSAVVFAGIGQKNNAETLCADESDCLMYAGGQKAL